MSSRKPQAKAKKLAQFKSSLGGMDDIFASEAARTSTQAAERDKARERKACSSKNRYSSRAEAQAAAADCAAHGAPELAIYHCKYCGGWHLTSHPRN